MNIRVIGIKNYILELREILNKLQITSLKKAKIMNEITETLNVYKNINLIILKLFALSFGNAMAYSNRAVESIISTLMKLL